MAGHEPPASMQPMSAISTKMDNAIESVSHRNARSPYFDRIGCGTSQAVSFGVAAGVGMLFNG